MTEYTLSYLLYRGVLTDSLKVSEISYLGVTEFLLSV